MAGHGVVQHVSFGLNGDEENLRRSHAPITSYELFSPAGAPVAGGVYDLRLGTTDHGFLCLTCAHGKKLCQGHGGHLTLRVAVTQPVGVAEIRRWLRVACFRCGGPVVDVEKFAALPPGRRLAAAGSASTGGRVCPACGAVHPEVTKDPNDHFTFWAEAVAPAAAAPARRGAPKAAGGDKLYPDTIAAIFSRITDATVVAFGRSPAAHPRKLVLRTIRIPPNTIRPGVKSFGGGGSSYHDSTNILQHLVKRNELLPKQLPDAMGPLGPGGPVDGDLDRAVQNEQQLYFDLIMGSSTTSVTQGNSGRRGLVTGSRPLHSFLRNLPRKMGRIRVNLLGKRVVYISRSTISGNMRFAVDQVGLPLEFARVLQVKETVQEYNRDWLMTFFLNGRRQYPGCTHLVRRASGEAHDVASLRDFRLEVGDVLYRDVVDGDLAYFNRQPTLERSSIGVHRVVVIQDPSIHTFQMNVLACEWYNADFDGDQMNLWVAREPAARAEAAIMSGVANWFISSKTSGPVNGEVQDSTVGAYEVSRAAVRMDKFHAMGLFAAARVEPPRFDAAPPGHVYSGRDVVSLLFEQTPVNYSRPPSSYSDVYAPYISYDPEETLTVVERGRLVRGVLDARSVGAKAAGGLFHLISREYGPGRALEMVYALQQVALQFLLYRGFTVGTADLLPSAAALEQIRALVASVRLESRLITERLLRGEIVPPIDSTVHEFHEQLQINALKVPEVEILRWILGTIRPDTNGFFRMIAAGSKGSNPNLIHVSGVIGQTEINGERMREQFGFRRTLPYYPRFSIDPAAYGFVANSYMTGMRVGEFTFQDMNGRFDLINKALSTASTGYFMRKGVMNNQSAVVDNYRRVTKDTRVVQVLYGEDGLDPRELEKVEFRTVLPSEADVRAAAGLDVRAALAARSGGAPAAGAPGRENEAAGGDIAAAQAAVDAAVEAILADRAAYRRTFGRLAAAGFDRQFETDRLMPINVRRVVDGVFIAAKASGAAPEPLTAAGLAARVARVADVCRRLPYTLLNEIAERRAAPVPAALRAAAALLCMLVRAELSPAVLARLSDAQLDFVVDAIRQRYSLSLVDYGTAAGVIAAQAISEPLTQYMLDSHHRSVAGGTNKSGLIRVSEIYGARPVAAEQSAAMLLPLAAGFFGAAGGAVGAAGAAAATDATGPAAVAAAQEIANSIEFVTLLDFTRQHDTLLEPPDALVYPLFAADRAWLDEFTRTHPLVSPPGDLTNWCFRFVLDKSALVLKAVELELIVRRLRARHPGIYVVHTPEAAPEVVIRAWLRASRGGIDEQEERLAELLETPVRGIKGILRTAVEKVTSMREGPDGAFEKSERLAIRTTGTNLYSALLHPAVDQRAAISTSIGDTFKLFGVEAARAKIVSETQSFMGKNAPNPRHLFIYADEMTRTGRVTSIERPGLSTREHGNVFLRMAYGSPIQAVTEATLANARCKVYGIAAPQLLGSVPQIGTLWNSAVVDEDFVRANTKSVDSILDDL